MSGPRNRAAYERGQALRGEIRAMMEGHSALKPPLTAKQVIRCLTHEPRPSKRAVQWHMKAIRAS